MKIQSALPYDVTVEKPLGQIGRRTFVAAGLFAAGGASGWLLRKAQRAPTRQSTPPSPGDKRFVYDVAEFEKTDPALVRYEPAGEFPTGFHRVKRLTAGSNNSVWVAGDRSARLFTPEGVLKREIQFDAHPHALRETGEGELLVAFARTFEVYDPSGKRRLRSESLGQSTFLTALASHENTIYLADAGQREVIICDRGSGSEIARFGKRDPVRSNPGFEVPSPYFDLSIAQDGLLRIVNPSRLRMETYSLDGQFQSSWGQAGLQVDRFCGCCNPVYFTLSSNGDFITSEKGIARIKIYGPDGEFKGVVAGSESLVEDKQLARRACEDCSVGAGFDVAIDQNRRVIALDPFRKVVRLFTPRIHAA